MFRFIMRTMHPSVRQMSSFGDRALSRYLHTGVSQIHTCFQGLSASGGGQTLDQGEASVSSAWAPEAGFLAVGPFELVGRSESMPVGARGSTPQAKRLAEA